MSENKGRAEYTKYDSLSTKELQEILYKHAHDELQIQLDTEELFYIMEVLEERKNDTPEQAAKVTQEAYATFRKNYMPKESAARTHTARWIRVAAVIAIVLVTLFAASTTAEAFGVDVWDKFAVWTKEFFSFSDGVHNTQPTEPDKTDPVEYSELQKALDQFNVTEKLAPTWLPEGYVNKNLYIVESPRVRNINGIFEKDGSELIIKICQTIGVQAPQVEKNDDLLEVYVVDGVEYYIFSNTETLQAAWSIGEFECIIGGKITLEEMKRMIDSIR